jgi:hypothetical protein
MQVETVSHLKRPTLFLFSLPSYFNLKSTIMFRLFTNIINFVYQSDSEIAFLIQGQGLHVIEDTWGKTPRI